MSWGVLADPLESQLGPLLRARHWVCGSEEVGRSCQDLDVSKV